MYHRLSKKKGMEEMGMLQENSKYEKRPKNARNRENQKGWIKKQKI